MVGRLGRYGRAVDVILGETEGLAVEAAGAGVARAAVGEVGPGGRPKGLAEVRAVGEVGPVDVLVAGLAEADMAFSLAIRSCASFSLLLSASMNDVLFHPPNILLEPAVLHVLTLDLGAAVVDCVDGVVAKEDGAFDGFGFDWVEADAAEKVPPPTAEDGVSRFPGVAAASRPAADPGAVLAEVDVVG